jgi:hypothetical protein
MKKFIVVALFAIAGFAAPAAAESPVAVVEDVQGKVTGAEFMDYVAPGKIIKLGPGASLVLGYMKSCRREIIAGLGTVIVGADESMVHLAEVKREKPECDSGHAHATARETSDVAATVVRSMAKDISTTPEVTLYGASPVVEARGRGTLVVERLDLKGERQRIELSGNQLKGRFYDFAGVNRSLTPGGTYAASFASSRIVFRVDPKAKPGPTPIVGRLLRME